MRQAMAGTGETAKSQRYTAPALEKGLDILELLSTEDAGLMQTEIARRLGRSVSEIFRMLVVLQDRGYVTQLPGSDRYVLTTLLFELAHRTPRVKRLTTIAAPVMQALAREVNQSCHLAMISGDAVIVVGQVDAPGNNIMSVRLGARIDAWRASSGRVILAHLGGEELAGMLASAPLPPGMAETQVRADLATIRAEGFEVRDSFVARGIVNISAPVFDHSGNAVAALTIPHLERYGEAISFEDCRAAVLRAAAAITRNLGGGVAGRTA
ncbi:MAG: IclR family transcriptional regulator [Rubellimicrobium sp.]|nr:IclR family transcriptional regulator [Rubellimicrobium sp.]